MKVYEVYKFNFQTQRNDLLYELNEEQYENWVKENASRNYGLYRIIGSSKIEYGIDFDTMYKIKVVDK